MVMIIMSKNSQAVRKCVKKKTRLLKESCGEKCCICGYNKTHRALCFHHVNPTKKDFTFSKNLFTKHSVIVKEVKKCLLVCSNCHAEIHDGLISQDIVNNIHQNFKYDENKLLELKPIIKTKIKRICICCKKEYLINNKKQKYCSFKCSKLSARKYKERPPRYILQKQIDETSVVAVGKKYGVSDNTIRKWLNYVE